MEDDDDAGMGLESEYILTFMTKADSYLYYATLEQSGEVVGRGEGATHTAAFSRAFIDAETRRHVTEEE